MNYLSVYFSKYARWNVYYITLVDNNDVFLGHAEIFCMIFNVFN